MSQGIYAGAFGMGAVLEDRWEVGALIGEGAVGWVFGGTDLRTGRPVAIKTLNARALADGALRQRFQKEAHVLARVRHPGIVRLLAHGGWDASPYVVMERVDGQTLGELMREAKRHFSTRSVRQVVGQLADALGHLHDLGVVYRDLKPDNVVVTPTAKVKLLDLGFARAEGDPTLTARGAAVGTPRYMAPEQCGLDATVDHRADIYALGVLAWELCTGRPLFDAHKVADLMRAHLFQPARDPRDLVPTVAPALANAVLHALRKDPDDRPQTMDAFRRALGIRSRRARSPAAAGRR